MVVPATACDSRGLQTDMGCITAKAFADWDVEAAQLGVAKRHIVEEKDVNVCTDAKFRGNTSAVLFLGNYPSHDMCEAAVLQVPRSTAYWYADKDFASENSQSTASWALGCYARTDGKWKPKKTKHCSSGKVIGDSPPPAPPGRGA